MKSEFLKILAVALFTLETLPSAFSQGPPIPSTLGYKSGTGWIMVYIRAPDGMPSTALPQITLTSAETNSPVQQTPRREGNAWVFSGLTNGADYQVQVVVEGFQPASQTVSIPATDFGTANVFIILKPGGSELEFKPPAGQFLLAPRVQKEVQSGIKDLNSGKASSAQKHFQKAIHMAPANPYLNYLMGMSYLLSKDLVSARSYIEQSISMDPNQSTSLSALGTVRYDQRDYAGAIDALNKAVALDPASWKDQWLLAGACLKSRDYQAALEHGEKALEMGKTAAEPVKIVLAEASASIGDRERALKMVDEFLSTHPKDETALHLRAWILARSTALSARSTSTSASTSASVDRPPRANWAPADVDDEKPLVSGEACSLSKVLKTAGKNAVRFVDDFQQFTSTEDYQTIQVKQDENLETAESHDFTYTATIEGQRDHIRIDESRGPNSTRAQMPDHLADTGLPALALAFHPSLQRDFSWSCEGLGRWKDLPAWVVRFEQLPDRPDELLNFQNLAGIYPLPVKARAWISEKGGNVLHVEAELDRPIAPVRLEHEQFVLDYQPVTFSGRNQTVWLPQNADIYYHYRGHYLHHFHHFSNFKLLRRGAPAESERSKTAKAKSPAS
ncbi:MAG TPA: tetratricopeptide repeat protein [Candidatus Acidoferrales bacterium]|nr:tetratricopeptide repeat protein [Candidatus Acidoferrales bacterium]